MRPDNDSFHVGCFHAQRVTAFPRAAPSAQSSGRCGLYAASLAFAASCAGVRAAGIAAGSIDFSIDVIAEAAPFTVSCGTSSPWFGDGSLQLIWAAATTILQRSGEPSAGAVHARASSILP